MYTISKDADGIVLLLICSDCPHVERIDLFDESLGNRRTQAARAKQNHSRDKAWRRIGAPADPEA